jgi:hypothetical protein
MYFYDSPTTLKKKDSNKRGLALQTYKSYFEFWNEGLFASTITSIKRPFITILVTNNQVEQLLSIFR